MMKRIAALLLLGLLALPGLSIASPASHRAAAERLLATLQQEKLFNGTVERMVTLQLRQNPQLAPFQDVMLKFFRKYMSYAAMKGQMVKLYVGAFTEKELDDINAFYHTPTGQKTVRVLPKLMSEGAQIGVQQVRAHMGELKAMIRARAEQLQAEKAKQEKGAGRQ
ncbi:MAG TPA: DUF2059 domain-containing protein [Gammaproteobacteria bacterium]|nr:DUF2059 domain-containing protein [Gammaproteobacteria bacterium]